MFKVIIPSKNIDNLNQCLNALFSNEPLLPLDSVIVVDDGLDLTRLDDWFEGVDIVKGEKPFNFAKNVNLGIKHAGKCDIIILNDDANLVSRLGFSRLHDFVLRNDELAIYSPGIRGAIGNANQQHTPEASLVQEELNCLMFVCVYLRKVVLDTLGFLDEIFSGYGYEDNDYCHRALEAKMKLIIWNGCVVDHSGKATFRTQANYEELFARNREIYANKWKT